MTKERSILRTIIVNFWNSIKPRKVWGNKVGKDYNGTEYYEGDMMKSTARSQPPRWFVPKERDNFQQDLPPEWEAWLRYRRNDPPTEEEVLGNLEKAKAVIAKAAELEKEYLKTEGEKEIRQVTTKEFPIYEDMEGMPGGSIKGTRDRLK